MITAIADLGKASELEEIEALVSHIDARLVLVIKIALIEGAAKYKGLSLEEKRADGLYLYRRDFSGRPGLFFTGKIGLFDVKKAKQNRLRSKSENIEESRDAVKQLKDFARKKIEWIPEGKLISDKAILKSIDDSMKTEIELIQNEFKSKLNLIENDVFAQIESLEPEELLLTVKLVDESGEHFVGAIPKYAELFKCYVIGEKESNNEANERRPLCTVCNRPAALSEFREKPLLFFTLDKPNFLPDGLAPNAYKVFPLCHRCYVDLQKGQKYLEDNLNFKIGLTSLRFWLIPVLGNVELAKSFLDDMNRGGLYLKNLSRLCQTVDTVTEYDSQTESFESFLSFNSVFYTIDSNGHMRLLTSLGGIYPRRLRAIVEAKKKMDSIPTFYKNNIRFGFPLLVEFLQDTKNKASDKMLASFLGNIFTGGTVDPLIVFRFVIGRIRNMVNDKLSMKEFTSTCLRGIAVIQYLIELNVIEIKGAEYMETEKAKCLDDPRIEEIKGFIQNHSNLISSTTLRAVFAIGTAVGILLETQRSKLSTKKSPFWNHLNRLEMDMDRIASLFPKVLNKMHQYEEHQYDSLLSYLGLEAANLDPTQKDISTELLNLVFAIGLSEGYLITQMK
jgi:CRISPR-associated Csh1 family protein